MDDGVEYDRIVDVSNLQTGEFSMMVSVLRLRAALEAPLIFGAILQVLLNLFEVLLGVATGCLLVLILRLFFCAQ